MKPDELLALAKRIAGNLTKCERDLLLGNCAGWGSWMFEAGEHMVMLGLGTKRDGSIKFDTKLGKEVAAALRAASHQDREGSDG